MTVQLQRCVEAAARKNDVIDDELVATIASDAVRNICEIFGGRRCYIPEFPEWQQRRLARDTAISLELREGRDPERIARSFGVSLKKVLRIASTLLAGTARLPRG